MSENLSIKELEKVIKLQDTFLKRQDEMIKRQDELIKRLFNLLDLDNKNKDEEFKNVRGD